jgi:Mg/Co/Ni transporter MgtE
MADTIVDLVGPLHSGDFTELRGELVQRRPQELASAFCDLRGADQVLAFRILPRRLAAAVFEIPLAC